MVELPPVLVAMLMDSTRIVSFVWPLASPTARTAYQLINVRIASPDFMQMRVGLARAAVFQIAMYVRAVLLALSAKQISISRNQLPHLAWQAVPHLECTWTLMKKPATTLAKRTASCAVGRQFAKLA